MPASVAVGQVVMIAIDWLGFGCLLGAGAGGSLIVRATSGWLIDLSTGSLWRKL